MSKARELSELGDKITVDGSGNSTFDGDVSAANLSTTGNVTVTGTINVTTVDLGNWTITESGGSLYFATGGTNMMKLNSSGTLDVAGDVNTNATIT